MARDFGVYLSVPDHYERENFWLKEGVPEDDLERKKGSGRRFSTPKRIKVYILVN